MAGGGVKKGLSFGETDDYCYNTVANPGNYPSLFGRGSPQVDLQISRPAFRLTDVHGNVVKEILA